MRDGKASLVVYPDNASPSNGVLTIPASVTAIKNAAIAANPNITSIVVEENETGTTIDRNLEMAASA